MGSSSVYKPVLIPPPQGVQPGQSWTLALFASTSPGWQLDLHSALNDTAEDIVPFPVLSESILFTAPSQAVGGKAKGKAKGTADKSKLGDKQDRIRRVFASENGCRMEMVEQTSFDLDKVRSFAFSFLAAFSFYLSD